MFNFLSGEYKKYARLEYKTRLFTTIFVLFSGVAVISAILVVPAYISANNDYNRSSFQEADAQKALKTGGENGVSVAVKKVNALMDAASSLPPLSPDSIAEAVDAARPRGVTVTSLSIGTTNSGIVTSVMGNAATRDELIAFVSALEGVAIFSKVDLPVSYLATDSNINYSITVSSAKSAAKK